MHPLPLHIRRAVVGDAAAFARIELTVFVDHPQAIGRCVDTFSMARLHPDPPRLSGADRH